MNDLVSVITPSFNYGRYIEQALFSVQNQSHTNWECIIIDDGSTDDTRERVRAWEKSDPRFRYIYQDNRGVSAARNNGLRQCKGQFIQFLDADDLIENLKLEKQVGFLATRYEIDIAYGSAKSFESEDFYDAGSLKNYAQIEWVPRISGGSRDALRSLMRSTFPTHCALLRRTVIDDIGFFDEGKRYCEDWSYWIRCAAKGKRFEYSDFEGATSYYRSHLASACANRSLNISGQRQMRREIDRMIEDPEIRALNRSLSASLEGYDGIRKMEDGKRFDGMRAFLRAGLMSPTFREMMKWFYCAGVAPFARKGNFENFVSLSAATSLKSILRSR